MAEEKGRTIRPHAALALNEELDTAAFPSVDLELPRALAYLRGETALSLPAHSDPGHGTLLVRYQGLPIGWMYRAGDRWNNGWPKPWRIRMR